MVPDVVLLQFVFVLPAVVVPVVLFGALAAAELPLVFVVEFVVVFVVFAEFAVFVVVPAAAVVPGGHGATVVLVVVVVVGFDGGFVVGVVVVVDGVVPGGLGGVVCANAGRAVLTRSPATEAKATNLARELMRCLLGK